MHIRWKKQLQERPVWLPSITYYPVNSNQTTKQNSKCSKVLGCLNFFLYSHLNPALSQSSMPSQNFSRRVTAGMLFTGKWANANRKPLSVTIANCITLHASSGSLLPVKYNFKGSEVVSFAPLWLQQFNKSEHAVMTNKCTCLLFPYFM